MLIRTFLIRRIKENNIMLMIIMGALILVGIIVGICVAKFM